MQIPTIGVNGRRSNNIHNKRNGEYGLEMIRGWKVHPPS